MRNAVVRKRLFPKKSVCYESCQARPSPSVPLLPFPGAAESQSGALPAVGKYEAILARSASEEERQINKIGKTSQNKETREKPWEIFSEKQNFRKKQKKKGKAVCNY